MEPNIDSCTTSHRRMRWTTSNLAELRLSETYRKHTPKHTRIILRNIPRKHTPTGWMNCFSGVLAVERSLFAEPPTMRHSSCKRCKSHIISQDMPKSYREIVFRNTCTCIHVYIHMHMCIIHYVYVYIHIHTYRYIYNTHATYTYVNIYTYLHGIPNAVALERRS